MKVIFPLSALTVFLFLAYLTHPGKRDGKNFVVFHLYSCFLFFFFSRSKILTLHSNKMSFSHHGYLCFQTNHVVLTFSECKEEIGGSF